MRSAWPRAGPIRDGYMAIMGWLGGSVEWLDTLDRMDKSDHNVWEYIVELDHNLMNIDPSHGDGTMSCQQATAGAGSAQKVDTPESEPAPRTEGD